MKASHRAGKERKRRQMLGLLSSTDGEQLAEAPASGTMIKTEPVPDPGLAGEEIVQPSGLNERMIKQEPRSANSFQRSGREIIEIADSSERFIKQEPKVAPFTPFGLREVIEISDDEEDVKLTGASMIATRRVAAHGLPTPTQTPVLPTGQASGESEPELLKQPEKNKIRVRFSSFSFSFGAGPNVSQRQKACGRRWLRTPEYSEW